MDNNSPPSSPPESAATNVPTPPSNPNTSVAAAAAVANNPCNCPGNVVATTAAQGNAAPGSLPNSCANVVTIPVPIVQNEENYTYVTVKGSLHDRTCAVFGLNEMEVQALSKRFGNGVKGAVNGVMVSCTPMDMVNTLAQLSYKVVCSCGEAEISWTMQREV